MNLKQENFIGSLGVQDFKLFDNETSLIKEMSEEIKNAKQEILKRDVVSNLPKQFDLDSFLNDFGKGECGDQKNIEFDDKRCFEYLKEHTFGIISQIDSHAENLQEHLTQNVFKPLAIDFKNFSNLSDFIYHLKNMPTQSSLLENQPLNVNYKLFENSILSAFLDINGKLSDVDSNKEAIS